MGNTTSLDENKFPLKIRSVKKYGYIPDIPDQRDIWTSFPNTIIPPNFADLRKTGQFPKIYNQGEMGSCTANAILASYEFSLAKSGHIKKDTLSAQFIYYNQRLLSGTSSCDSGASIRDGIKVINRLGVCFDNYYPYDLISFLYRPTTEAYKNASENKSIVQYRRLKLNIEDIMKSISVRIPVIMGFTVYESFTHNDVAKTGIMPSPKLGEKIVGSHAVLIVGYDAFRKFFLCRNSWGETWGQGGHFWMPFSFINPRNCGDLWIISTGTIPKVSIGNASAKNASAEKARVGGNPSVRVEREKVEEKVEREKVEEKLIEKVDAEIDFKEDSSKEDEIGETDADNYDSI